VGSAFGTTKGKANEAGENLEEKTEAARKEASARAHAAKEASTPLIVSGLARPPTMLCSRKHRKPRACLVDLHTPQYRELLVSGTW
jgi:hypothetical protein